MTNYNKTFRIKKNGTEQFIEVTTTEDSNMVEGEREKAINAVVKTAVAFEDSLNDVLDALNGFSELKARKNTPTTYTMEEN